MYVCMYCKLAGYHRSRLPGHKNSFFKLIVVSLYILVLSTKILKQY